MKRLSLISLALATSLGALPGIEKESCFSTADAEHAADEAAAIATRDAALVAADYH